MLWRLLVKVDETSSLNILNCEDVRNPGGFSHDAKNVQQRREGRKGKEKKERKNPLKM